MIQNHVYLALYDRPNEFENIADKGIQYCVWELGIIEHERKQWIEHVLKNAEAPDFKEYLTSVYLEQIV